MEKKQVIIDGEEYEVTLFSDRKGQTGCCYRLQVPEKNLDLAVKLYHQDFGCDYLDLEDISRMREFFMDSFPICLSEYPVFDEEKKYIGSASSYLEEIVGPTDEVIYQLPLEEVYRDLSYLEEKIALVTMKKLVLWDWEVGNLLYGKGQNLPLGLYAIDDSGYYFDSHVTWEENRQMLSYLINDIIAGYVFRYAQSLKDPISEKILFPYLKSEDSFSLLKQESRNYSSLQDYLLDKVELVKRRRF